MATPHEPTPPLGADNSSMSEPDEMPLSQLRRDERNAVLEDFSIFGRALHDSLKELLANRRYGRYNSVHVLFLAWKTTQTREIEELPQLEEVFKNQLKFTTERYDITREQLEESLDSRLEAAVRSHAGADELLIIYYAGHGRLDKHRNTTTWQPTMDSSTPGDDIVLPLNWSVFEDRLNQTIVKDSHILYIVDSCYKPRKYTANSRGSKELLATSQAAAGYSFTRDLTDELQAHFSKTGSISVSTLHSRIIERQAQRQISEPYHLPLSDKASPPSIVLASMTEDGPRMPTSLGKSQSVTICMIRVKNSPPSDPAKWWKEYIVNSVTVEKTDLGDYVKLLVCDRVDEVHVFLVSMPSKVSRKIVKRIRWRAFAELKTVTSEAALSQDVMNEAWRKAILP